MMRFASLLLLLSAACGGHDTGEIDETIGATCARDGDCEDRCFLDNNDKFPGGFCSIVCVSDQDCPADAFCMTAGGGACLFACPQFNCADLGPGWQCKAKDRIGGGEASVCIGD